MSVPHLFAASTVETFTLTSGRLLGTAAAVAALAGAIIGGLALARPTGRNGDRNETWRPAVALGAGMAGILAGGLVVVTADGGPGTGNGIVGGYAALALGLIATILGGLALARTRRATRWLIR